MVRVDARSSTRFVRRSSAGLVNRCYQTIATACRTQMQHDVSHVWRDAMSLRGAPLGDGRWPRRMPRGRSTDARRVGFSVAAPQNPFLA
jgi:hypothetical protein